jgi:hypothetical protein
MTGITQTVPNYFGGISEQPDYIKEPGQVKNVVNAIPDLTYGLYKRPGSKRVGTAALSAGTGGAWFHYFRDETEGAYVGRIDSSGGIKMWKCNDGTEFYNGHSTAAQQINYGSGLKSAIDTYLTTSTPSDLKFLTVNDTTFVTNSTKTVGITGTTTAKPHTYAAYVELIKTENGRQYSLNLSTNDTTQSLSTATRLKIASNTQPSAGTCGTGHCPGIGTGVFSENSGGGNTNLIFRLTIRGQQGRSTCDTDADNVGHYTCAYSNEVTLLHGGEGWTNGNQCTVTVSGYNYTIEVADSEVSKQQANLKAVRPKPTPFDSDTAVSATHILGGIAAELAGISGIDYTVIGNGVYIYSNTVDFNVQVVENDLMKVITSEANDIGDLPFQCKNGYIVKVNNTKAQEDDYYLKFKGESDGDGSGSWQECAKPGIDKSINPATMPITIQRQANGSFLVDYFTWKDRDVGDDITNAAPRFAGQKINRMLFWRNRLAILADKFVVLSRPGDFGNFWINTAVAVSTSDPIDIACSSSYPSALLHGLEQPDGLLIFSSDQQFFLNTTDSILNPDTARLSSIANYNYNKNTAPISLGTTVGFVDNSGQYSKFFEAVNLGARANPDIVDQSKVVSRLLPKDLDLITNSRENGLVLIGKSNTDTIYGFKYFTVAEKRYQQAWFKWKLVNKVKYHFIVGDKYYFVDDNNFLQHINITQEADDPLVTQDGNDYLLHLDNYTTLSGGSYSESTHITTFSGVSWISSVSNANGDLVLIDDNETNNTARYIKPTINGTTLTASGNWSSVTLKIGYLYDYQVEFPRFYPTKSDGRKFVADVNASLVIHRVKLGLGRIGTYQSILKRVGKTDYTAEYESTPLDLYESNDVPYLIEDVKTIPIYEKNTNIGLTVKSSHPSPATIRSLSWEGDYTPKYYKRV